MAAGKGRNGPVAAALGRHGVPPEAAVRVMASQVATGVERKRAVLRRGHFLCSKEGPRVDV